MILRQLIHAGRHFCECRSSSFIPKNESELTLVAYTMHDEFKARRFSLDLENLDDLLVGWLTDSEAIGYLHIERHDQKRQIELPFPIGRSPMDRLIHIAATRDEFEVLTYFLEEKPHLKACRLHLAETWRSADRSRIPNLLNPQSPEAPTDNATLYFQFAS